MRTTNWSCLPLPPSPCASRSAHASPSPVTYQNGACFKKSNYHLFSLRISDKTTSLRSRVYTFMYSCDSSCQLKRHVSSQFISSLFPLHLRHFSNWYNQRHLQIEKVIICMYSLHYSHCIAIVPTRGTKLWEATATARTIVMPNNKVCDVNHHQGRWEGRNF